MIADTSFIICILNSWPGVAALEYSISSIRSNAVRLAGTYRVDLVETPEYAPRAGILDFADDKIWIENCFIARNIQATSSLVSVRIEFYCVSKGLADRG
jgi:hypothetical protein